VSERGVFAVDRGIWDHPVLQSRDPFSKREAWLWMLSAATWKAKTVFVDGKRVSLKRGQLAHSIRFMADQWGWPKSNVARFLSTLKSETMIGTENGTSITVITISKYEEYQKVSLPRGTPNEPDSGTRMGHERDKEENRETKEEDSEANASGADAPIDPSIAERELFQRGRTVLGQKSGGLIAKLLKVRGGNVALARAAIETAATKEAPIEFIAAICRGPPAFQPRTRKEQESQDWHDARQKLRQFAYGDQDGDTGGGSPVRLLPPIGGK
jgi:hypothetical protein